MAIYISSQEEIEKYYNSTYLNQSKLKNLEKGLYFYKKALIKEESYKSYFVIGSAIDVLLTGNPGDFEKNFLIINIDYPTEIIKNIIEDVYSNINNTLKIKNLKDYTEIILKIRQKHKYCLSYKEKTIIERIVKEGNTYFETLKKINNSNKQNISKKEYQIVRKVVKSFKNSKQTRKFFDKKFQRSLKNVDFYYQLPIYFTYKNVNCKALLDLVVVVKDSKGKAIYIEPYDIKTMSQDVLQFRDSFKKLRYDIQGAFYTEALKYWINNNLLKGAKIKNFSFIVESTLYPKNPVIYKMTDEALKGALNGFYKDFKDYRGIISLLEEYSFYKKNGWEIPKILIENNYTLSINF